MKLTVISRQDKKAKELRKEGLVPGIIYGKHLEAPITVACNKNDFIKRYKEAGYSTPLMLEGDKLNQLVLIQDIQVDPVTDVLMHIDFLAIKADEKVKTEVAIKLTGESSVEKLNLGQIQLIKDFVEVEAFPQDLPNNITIDISSIENVNDVIFVKDIQISNKVEVLDDPEQALVIVATVAEETAEEASAEGAAPAEGAAEGAAAPAKEEKKEEKK